MEYWLELCQDIVIYIVSSFALVIFSLKAPPYERGFYCNDERITLPFIEHKEWHVTTGMLFCFTVLFPIVCMVVLEYLRVRDSARRVNTRTPWNLVGYCIHKTLRNWAFAFNLVVGLSEILKCSVGRLRPHFIDECKPQWDDIECTDIDGNYVYHTGIPFATTDLRRLSEARKSFPSGHAVLAAFSMVYLVIYFQVRKKYLPKLLILLLQGVCFLIAAYTSVSRVVDHAHHRSDVMAGVSIGALTAVISAIFASDLFTNKDLNISETRKER